MRFRDSLEAFLRVAYSHDCDRFDMAHALRECADVIEHGDIVEEHIDQTILIGTLVDQITR